jgi:hypothetical protein
MIKISSTGEKLPNNATTWDAVLLPDFGLMVAVGVCPKALTYKQAEALIKKLNKDSFLGFTDWRMPSVKEEFAHVDHTRHSPAADTSIYPDMQSSWYWTSTELAWSSGYVWLVDFDLGHVSSYYRGDEYFVRPVRDMLPGEFE